MKKSKQFSNKLIARKDLINSVSAISAFLIVIFGIIMFLLVLSPEQDVNGKITFLIEQRMMYSGSYYFCAEHENVFLITIIGGLALGISQFEFLHRKKYCSTLLSFGIKRNKLFWNRFIVPLALSLICIILPYAIALKLNIDIFGFKADMFSWFFFELIRVIRVFIASYTISIVACIFTGRTIEAVAGAISIALFPLATATLTDIIFDLSLFGYAGPFYSQTADILVKADPIFISSLLYSRSFDIAYSTNTPLDTDAVIQIVFSLVWIIVSITAIAFVKNYFNKKYKPENSGFKGIHNGIVMLISFTAPLLISALIIEYLDSYFSPSISSSIKAITICISLVTGFIASLVCGFIVHFTFKKIKASVVGGVAVIGTIGIALFLGVTGILGTYHNTPKAEEIAKIEVEAPFNEFFPDIYESFTDFTQQYVNGSDTALVVTDKDDIKTVLKLHKTVSDDTENATTSSFNLTYTLKDGSTVTRKYKYIGEEATKEMLKLWDTKAAKELYKNFFFPKFDGVGNLDYSSSTSSRYEHPFIMDYNDEEAYILITTRDLETKSVLDEITEAEFNKLKKAIYKDICTLNSSEWFTPEETQIGTLSFCFASYQKFTNEACGAKFYITPNMSNTVKVLKDTGLYKYFKNEKEIETVFVADVKEYISWENRALATNKKDVAVHQPYFSYMHNGWSHVCFTSYKNGEYIPPVKEVTDKMQIKSLTEKGYIAYNIFNNGKLVFVKYSDDTLSSYVIPYEK